MESLHLIWLKLLLCHDTSYILCHVTSKSIYVDLLKFLALPSPSLPIQFLQSFSYLFFFLLFFSPSISHSTVTLAPTISLPSQLVWCYTQSEFFSHILTLFFPYIFKPYRDFNPFSSNFFFILIYSYSLCYSLSLSLSHSFHVMLTKKKKLIILFIFLDFFFGQIFHCFCHLFDGFFILSFNSISVQCVLLFLANQSQLMFVCVHIYVYVDSLSQAFWALALIIFV